MEDDWLVWRYEGSRPRLRSMAYRMLGSMNDADDAVQEAWIHVAGGGARGVANIEGWFTTIVARVCLDMLRARKSRREEPVDPGAPDTALAGNAAAGGAGGTAVGGTALGGPEQEAVLADSVGLALLVVLDTLTPAERVAFVLHETFGIPFAEIAAITGRTPDAARQLASRARRRVRGGSGTPAGLAPGGAASAGSAREARLARQRSLAEAYLAAVRGGDLAGLLAILDPEVVLRGDAAVVPSGRPVTLRGATTVATAAGSAAVRSRYSDVALINGLPGIVYAPRGHLEVVLAFAYSGEKISEIDVIGERERLDSLELAVLDA